MSETQTFQVELAHLEISKPVRIQVLGLNPVTGDVRVRMTDNDVQFNLKPSKGDFSTGGPADNKRGKLHPDGTITFSTAIKQEPRVKNSAGCIYRQTSNM